MLRKIVKLKVLYTVFTISLVIYFINAPQYLPKINCYLSCFFQSFHSDLFEINDVANKCDLYVYVIDEEFQKNLEENHSCSCRDQAVKNYRFGIDNRSLSGPGIHKVRQLFTSNGFETVVFYDEQAAKIQPGFSSSLPVSLILKKSYVFVMHILHTREDNTWWFGSLANDNHCITKIKEMSLSNFNCSIEYWHASALNRLSFSKKGSSNKALSRIILPNDQNFFKEMKNSNFIDCNQTTANLFKKMYGQNNKPEALRFRHRAWKLLSKAKTILDMLDVPFWLSSGTCLGFFRECDFIPHSKDVDIGVFAHDFNSDIIPNMEAHGLKLIHWFGLLNDSLELSFIDKGGIKLDIFFFYDDGDHFWNGGTQLRTRKKFKYIFPKFTLCWTIFCGLKVRVPCQTEEYIKANYGDDWFKPIEVWDWKNSPSNVYFNGYWTKSVSSFGIKQLNQLNRWKELLIGAMKRFPTAVHDYKKDS